MKKFLSLTFSCILLIFTINCSGMKSADFTQVSLSSGTPPSTTLPAPQAATGNQWIKDNFATAQNYTGAYTARTIVETPALIHDATGTNAKYAFDIKETTGLDDRRVALTNVRITNLVSADAFGGGFVSAGAPGLKLFISNVYIEPNWPLWVSYAATNYDGIVLDGASEFYAEDLTIKNWNADGAIDNKAPISQFVRLSIQGRGNRGIRFWGAGPHYIVDSDLNNTGGLGDGTILWFLNCSTAKVYIYNSKFNGSSTVPLDKIGCDDGGVANITYLTVDPKTTGEMHPMF